MKDKIYNESFYDLFEKNFELKFFSIFIIKDEMKKLVCIRQVKVLWKYLQSAKFSEYFTDEQLTAWMCSGWLVDSSSWDSSLMNFSRDVYARFECAEKLLQNL